MSEYQAVWPFPVGNKPDAVHLQRAKAPVLKTCAPNATKQDFMVANRIRVVHFFDRTDPKGGVTVAYRKTSEHNSSNMVEVAVAYCSPKDQFSKKIGTSLALEYFEEARTILVPARVSGTDDFTIPILEAMFYRYAVLKDVESE